MAMCLMWIGAISLAIVVFLDTTVSTGWIIAGVLLFAMVVSLTVMFREVRNAPEMPDYFNELELSIQEAGQVVSSRQRFRHFDTRFGSRGTTAGSYDRVMPRRVRARQNRPRTSSWT